MRIHALLLACAATFAGGSCNRDDDEPIAVALELPATIELGALATPSISIDQLPNSASYGLHFTTYEALGSPQWELQRRAGPDAAWQAVTSDGAFYALGATVSGSQFRVRVCQAGLCSGFSPVVTVRLPTPSSTTPQITVEWGNPDAGEPCEVPPAPPPSDVVGTIPGTASVDGGDGTYTVPIDVPPGRNGMQPTVSLTYSSSGGEGVAGYGWSLSAASKIHRCGRTEALDRDTRRVGFIGIDRLCLDGAPLVLVSGTYGTSGAIYRAEREKHDRITQAGPLSGASSCFTVERKSGLRQKYGNCDGLVGVFSVNVPLHGSVPQSWSLVREIDRQRNIIDYDYTVAGGEHLLVAIRYGGHVSELAPPLDRQIIFSYRAADQRVAYHFRGVQQRATQELTAIRTWVGTVPVKLYELTQRPSQATGRRLLASIQMCPAPGHAGGCDDGTALPPTTFSYQEDTPSYVREREPLPDHALSRKFVLGDYDGDGVRDKLVRTSKTPWGGATTGARLELSGFGTPRNVDIVVNGVHTPLAAGFQYDVPGVSLPRELDVDFDRDGRDDLIGKDASNNFAIASWTGAAFELRSSDLPAFDESGIVDGVLVFQPRDFNGDGKLDLFSYRTHTLHLQCRDHTPGGAALQFCAAIQLPQLATLGRCDQVLDIRDWNGDGLPDFLIDTDNYERCNDPGQQPRILMSQGRFVPADPTQTYLMVDLGATFPDTLVGSHIAHRLFADVNGDGLTDIVSPGKIPQLWINRGGTFVRHQVSNGRINFGDTPWTDQTWNADATLHDDEDVWGKLGRHAQVADFDGDGRDDLMVPVETTAPACTVTNTNSGSDHCLMRAMTSAVGDASSAEWGYVNAFSYEGGGNAGDHCYQTALDEGNLREHCSVVDGAPNFAEDGDFYQDHAPRHHTIYRWDAVSFTIDDTTGATIRQRRTNFEGPIGRTRFADWNGDGLADGVARIGSVYGYNCGHSPCPLVQVSYYQDATLWTDGQTPDRIIPVEDATGPPYYYTGGQPGIRVNAGHGQFIERQVARHPDLLIAAVNGLGHRSTWAYSSLSGTGDATCNDRPQGLGSSKPYTPQPLYRARFATPVTAEDRANVLFSSAKVVVSKFRTDNGATVADVAAVPNTSCFRYEDARWNNQGRGFLGFEKIVEERRTPMGWDTDVRVETTYETRWPRAGRVREHKTALATDPIGDDVFFAKTATTWEQDCSFPGTRPAGEPFADICFVYDTVETRTHRDLKTRALAGTETTTRVYAPADLPFGNVTSVTSARQDTQTHSTTTTYGYDYSAAAAWWIDRMSTATTVAQPIQDPHLNVATPARTVTRRFVYYPDGDPAARLVHQEYLQENIDGESLVLDSTYDAFGNRTVLVETGSRAAPRTTTATYQAPNGSNGYFADAVTDAIGTTTYTYDPATGAIRKAIDPNLAVLERDYDRLGRLERERVPGEQSSYHRVYACDDSCPPGAVFRTQRTQAGFPTIYLSHDVFGRTVLEERTAFDNTRRIGVASSYDALGRLFQVTAPSYDPATAPITWTGHDALGRPTGRWMLLDDPALVRHENYAYAGLTTTISRGDGSSETRTTDVTGRILEVVGATGRVRYRYEPLGRLALTEDLNGNHSTIAYDARGRAVQTQDPDRGTHLYTYDGLGRQLSHRDPRGNTVRTTYDTLGRPLTRTLDGEAAPLATWRYDTKRKGQLDDEVAGAFARYYQYDTAGRVNQVRTQIDGRSFFVAHEFDCTGRPVSLRFPSGKELGLHYNDAGYVDRHDDWSYGFGPPVALRTIDAHDALGGIAQATFANGAIEQREVYLATGQLRHHTVDAGAARIHDVTYGYWDESPDLESRRNDTLGVVETFGYDGLHRLRRATRTWTAGHPTQELTYTYDAAGNFESKSDRALSYVRGDAARSAPSFAGPNGIRSYTRPDGTVVSDFRYDAGGNLVAGDGRAITYERQFDLPATIVRGTDSVALSYDPWGARYKKVAGGKTTYYLGGSLYEHTEDATGKVTLQHAIGGFATQVLTRASLVPNGAQTTSFLHLDRLGSLELVTPATAIELAAQTAANTLERHAFDPFGGPRNGDWTDGSGVWSSPATTRGFTGHEHLGDSQLIHMNGRVYDPTHGRFLSADPTVPHPLDSQSFNRYIYMRASPLAGTDPSGFADKPVEAIGDPNVVEITGRRPPYLQPRVLSFHQDTRFWGWQASRDHRARTDGAASIGPGREVDRHRQRDTGPDPVTEENAANARALISVEAARYGVVPEVLAPGIAQGGEDAYDAVSRFFVGVAEAAHEMLFEIRNQYNEISSEGYVVSGGTHPGHRLSWPMQSATHTEHRAYSADQLGPGESSLALGTRDPCPHCQGVMKRATQPGGLIKYVNIKTGRVFRYLAGKQYRPPRLPMRVNLLPRRR